MKQKKKHVFDKALCRFHCHNQITMYMLLHVLHANYMYMYYMHTYIHRILLMAYFTNVLLSTLVLSLKSLVSYT